ncbi:hypothetical protein Pyn_21503 [Prunus yedoensis var. nudiflora]|uniref:Uncharacterized protein n=1 Tax=Prunus yedoensis var. nudiflora TaxID=2094558 RepID=A0A314UAZ9_PRUYE|nr:hypothetical protein Pyn_21503 [Prunus yedoensis var. nudiflora]
MGPSHSNARGLLEWDCGMDGNELSWGPLMGQEMEVLGRLGASGLRPIFLGPNTGKHKRGNGPLLQLE